jgi:hypothetical protein
MASMALFFFLGISPKKVVKILWHFFSYPVLRRRSIESLCKKEKKQKLHNTGVNLAVVYLEIAELL